MQCEGWWPEVRALVDAIRTGEGASRPDVRRWAESRAAGDDDAERPAGAPEALIGYADLVATAAYRTTDADIDRLRASGLSDDEIFEITAAVAVGAGRRRLERALAALDETGA
jgi:alkylhydroperoxidase family enzyme